MPLCAGDIAHVRLSAPVQGRAESVGRFIVVQIADAETRLRQRLSEAGVAPGDRSFLATWEVFKQFAADSVDSPTDGLLFESGVYRFTGPERFTVHFLRQFEVAYEDGDHDHYEQLRCEFLYEPTDELRSLGSLNLWCFPSDGDSIADWFKEVEDRVEFEWATRLVPSKATVSQETV